MTFRAFSKGLRAALPPIWKSVTAAVDSSENRIYPSWKRRIVAFLSALFWTGMTLPAGVSFFFRITIRGSQTYSPTAGAIICGLSIAGAVLIYLGGRIGGLWFGVPLAIWGEELMRGLIEQKAWPGEWPVFIIAVVLMLPLCLTIAAWRDLGWLRDKGPGKAPAPTPMAVTAPEAQDPPRTQLP
jgi:hypothetical protein